MAKNGPMSGVAAAMIGARNVESKTSSLTRVRKWFIRRQKCTQPGGSHCLGEINLSFGFDDKEGVGVEVAGVAEFLAGFIEGVGYDGEEDFAFCAADEIEAALLLDELELGRHARTLACAC